VVRFRLTNSPSGTIAPDAERVFNVSIAASECRNGQSAWA